MKANTRRCVSLKAQTYVRLRNYARREHKSSSGILEVLITQWLDASGEPTVERVAALRELGELVDDGEDPDAPPRTLAAALFHHDRCTDPGCDLCPKLERGGAFGPIVRREDRGKQVRR